MRQFIAENFPDARGILCLSGKAYRYFRQVLRVKNGDMVAVRMPDGTLQNMTVCQIDEVSRGLELQVCDGKGSITRGTQASEVLKPAFELWLFQFVAKPPKMDVIIRQAVECGVSKIIPVAGDYTQKENASFSNARKDRIERIIREARQQSGSPVNTVCHDVLDLNQAMDLWNENPTEECLAVALYERTDGTRELNSLASSGKKIKKVAIAVGCEGGISPNEIDVLKKNAFLPVHFETNILRCETAALYGIAVMQSLVLRKNECQ